MAKKGDLLVTIKGDATQFDKTISESTNQVRKFNSSANQAGSSVGGFTAGMGKLAGTFGKLAGPLGIAITAISTLNKAMNATETSTDFFANNIAAAGDSVTQFFVALQTGDFSNFDKGLTDIWRRAKDAVEALDQLGNTAKSLQFIKAFGDLGISDLMEDIFDSDNVKDQLNMLEKAKGIAEEIKEAAEEQQKDTKTVIDTKFASYGLPADLITKERLKATFSLDAKVNKDQVKKEAEEGVKAYNKELKQLKKDSEFIYDNVTKYGRNKSKGFNQTTYNEGKKALQEKYADALVTDIALNKMNNDEVLFPMVDAYIKSAQDLNAAQKGINQLQKTEKKINQGNYGNAGLKNTSSSNSPTIFVDGSMAKAEQEVQKYTKEVNEAVIGTDKWKEAQQNLNKAIGDKNILEIGAIQSIQIEDLTYEQVQEAHKRILNLIGSTTNKELREQFEKIANSYENRIKEMDFEMQTKITTGLIINTPNTYNFKGVDKESQELEKSINELKLQIRQEKDPFKMNEIYDKLSTKESRLSELNAIQNRPYITNSLDESLLKQLGIESNPTVDFTNTNSLEKYKKHLMDVLELVYKIRDGFDNLTPNEDAKFDQIISKLETELIIVGQRFTDLMEDEYNIDLANLMDQSIDSNRVKLLEAINNVKVGINNNEVQLDQMKTNFTVMSQSGEELGAFVKQMEEKELYIKNLISFYQQLLGIYELGQSKLDESMLKKVEATNQWRDALSDVGTMFYNIGAISDESTARTLSGLSSVFSGIQQMIPAIQTLTLLNQKDALAAAVKSGAALPFPANLAAIGASVAAVIAGFAQMASVPKFAEGGLVYGNTIAQVGEYAGASSNPEVIAPLSKLKNILTESGGTGGNVQFRIQGKELVGVLDNYSSIKKKR